MVINKNKNAPIPVFLRCEYLNNPLGINTISPRLFWQLKSNPDRRGTRQTAYQILVASNPDMLDREYTDLWDSGKMSSSEQLHVRYSGKKLQAGQTVWWKVRVWDESDWSSVWSEKAFWSVGLLSETDWKPAEWIGARPQLSGYKPMSDRDYAALVLQKKPSDTIKVPDVLSTVMIRKEFEISQPIDKAMLSICGLGLYELYINGQKAGDNILAPEWTTYKKRIQYQTIDVTAILHQGRNAMGAMLAEGWWAGSLFKKPPIKDPVFSLILKLEIELSNGNKEIIFTDLTWKACIKSPIIASGIYFGEVFNGNFVQSGWDQPNFDDSDWGNTISCNPAVDAELTSQMNEPIKIVKEIKPISVSEPRPGIFVFDLGVNIAGCCRIKISEVGKHEVTLRHGEMLNDNGTVYTDNLRGIPQLFKIIHPGGIHEYEPHFTYFGFRYIEIEGLTKMPMIDFLSGIQFNSFLERSGDFSCSNDLVNQLMKLIYRSQQANMMGVMTDCPQRSERLGHFGDFQIFAQTAIFNMNMAAFINKTLDDLFDGQGEEGWLPTFAPFPIGYDVDVPGNKGVPGYSDAGPIILWKEYVNYADRTILENYFVKTIKWIDYIAANNPDFLYRFKRGNDFGDWLNGDTVRATDYPGLVVWKPETYEGTRYSVDKLLFASAYWYYATMLTVRMATVLKRYQDARRLKELAENILYAIEIEFFSIEDWLGKQNQATYALVLHMDLIQDVALKENTLKALHESIKSNSYRLTTGNHTTPMLMNVLSKGGYHEDACRIINQKECPSWGYMIYMGATTIWERWDGFINESGFQDRGMNSFNHYTFGAVGEWIWRNIAGIYPDEQVAGFGRVIINPKPYPQLGFSAAKCCYNSIRGPIRTDWKIENNVYNLRVEIPANTNALIYLPCQDIDSVRESGRHIKNADGILQNDFKEGYVICSVGSGSYDFQCAWS